MTKTKYNTRKATRTESNLPTKKTKHNTPESNLNVANINNTNVNEIINDNITPGKNILENINKVPKNNNIMANVTPNIKESPIDNNNNFTDNNSLAENNNNIVEHLFIENNNFQSSFGKFNITYIYFF